jgi:RNA polymerase-binding transcription factor DksA
MPADVGLFPPPGMARRSPAADARHLHPAALPHWRALLGCLWQEHKDRVTGFCLACHDARQAAADPGGGPDTRQAAWRRASAMWHWAVAEWRALAEIEAALSRLAAGRFGWCQQCGAAIAASRLTQIPQIRYCPACDH